MHIFRIIFLANLLLILSSCTIYKSSDRKDYESAQNTSAEKLFKLSQLKPTQCSSESLRPQALLSKLVQIKESLNTSIFIWEVHIPNIYGSTDIYYESQNELNEYCLYE